MSGPLAGMRGVELAGQGPTPFAAMVLADLGADIVRIDRVDDVDTGPPPDHILLRGRRSAAIDIRTITGASIVRQLATHADFLIEGFRPGVAERLGVGPEQCLMVNPRLVYGRMTGWGQSGPYAASPGHDINYIAVTGVLNAIGQPGGDPVPPLNLIGDFGGGGMLMAVGILSALLERVHSGAGQVVDGAMLDGTLLLATQAFGFVADGRWTDQRGANTLDGGAPYYGVYPTADGGYISVGALERRFFDGLLDALGLTGQFPDQHDRSCWPEMRRCFAAAFRTRTGAEWAQLASSRQLCVSPVRSFWDAHRDEQSQARGCFVDVGGVRQPAPAPRFDRTPAAVPDDPPAAGQHTVEILLDAGFTRDAVADLAAHNIVRAPASVQTPSRRALFPGG